MNPALPALFAHAVTTFQGNEPADRQPDRAGKRCGEDLAGAREPNRLMVGLVPGQGIFRADHFLAMAIVRNGLGSRLVILVPAPMWNSTHIAEVEVVWDETLALEGRAGHYDGVGALRVTWAVEPIRDGFRALLARRHGRSIDIRSRRGTDMTRALP